jgi:hypothetical protein
MKYIELNPVRAIMVDAPNLYRWSNANRLSGFDHRIALIRN